MDNLTIIANAYLLTCDPLNKAGRHHLLIRKGRIAEIADRKETLTSLYPNATVIDASGKLITPGFVNAHFHGESFLLRKLTNNLHLAAWGRDPRLERAREKLYSVEMRESLADLYLAAAVAHLKSGTTCVGEFGAPLDERGFNGLVEGLNRSGIRSIVTLQNWDQIGTQKGLKGDRPPVNVCIGREEDLTVYSFESLARTAKDLRVPLLAHLAEQRDDLDTLRRNFQKDPVHLLRAFDLLKPGTVLVHFNYCSAEEVTILKEAESTVVITAQSTALKQSGYPALRNLVSNHIRLALGTDWGNVDVISEMRFVQRLPRLLRNFRPMSAMEIVRMGTINGAHALGVSHDTGSLECGKSADMLFFDLNDIRIPPISDDSTAEEVATLLINHLTSFQIEDVMVHGEFVVKGRRCTRVVEEDVIGAFAAISATVLSPSVTKKAHSVGDHLPTGAAAKLRVMPFLTEPAGVSGEVADFEAGFPSTVTSAHITGAGSNNDVEEKDQNVPSSPRKVELPKETRRSFGEDDF